MTSRAARTHGLSLVELLVVIGVIAVIIGLMLPTLGRTIFRTKQTRRALSTNQLVTTLTAYAVDYHDVFPIAAGCTTSADARLRFAEPLLSGGYAGSLHELDPEGMKGIGTLTILLSETLVCDANAFSPVSPVRQADRRPQVVRWSDVLFPSQKGALWHTWVMHAQPAPAGYWCCGPGQPKAPVAFCDRSVREFAWHELVPTGELPTNDELQVGSPVDTTWNGYRGIDLGSTRP